MAQELDALWRDKLEPWLKGLEAERRQAIRNVWVWGLIATGAGGVIMIIASFINDELLAFIPVALVLGLIAAIIALDRVEKLRARIKLELNTQIAAALDLDYALKPKSTPRFDRFSELHILPHSDRRRFEDYFGGEVSGCPFELYEATLEQRHTRIVTTKNGTRTETYYVTVFHGVLVRIEFPRKVEGITIVTRDAGWFNGLSGGSVDGRKLERIGLVDPQFEDIFEVYGDDQVLARYMLTPSFMERLLALEEALKGKSVQAAFDANSGGGELLIAAQTGNLFEAGSMYKPLADQGRVQSVIEDIRLITEIIDLLVKPAEFGEHEADPSPSSS
jgi:hypothetical protein